MAISVVFEDGEDNASAMASMFAGLIQANVEQHPEREADMLQLSGKSVCIEVPDIEEALTLEFLERQLLVRNGKKGNPAVTIAADSDVAMGMSLMKIGLAGMPVYWDGAGRDVVRALVRRKLKINRPWRIDVLNPLTRLFSVA
jgi:hypothetical protein